MNTPARCPSALLIALMMIWSPGCNRGGASSTATTQPGRIKIGFIVKQPDQPWFQNEWKFAQQAADKDGFDLITLGGTDGQTVRNAINSLAAQGAQGMIICTPDTRLGPAIMDQAQKYNIKVFSVDDQFVDADGKPLDEPHMGISASDIGKTVGHALSAEMKKRNWSPADTGACIPTFDQLTTAHDRTTGVIDALTADGFPADHIFTNPMADATVIGGRDAASIVLNRHPEVKHWLAAGMNDEAVIGAVRAIENRGFQAADIIGIGIGGDASQAEFNAAQPTGVFASVLISPRRHGFESSELMYHWIKDGTAPPPLTLTTGILIDRDNFKQVLHDQGMD
jgi:L-arabinose transport system substrate-binding protein